MPLSITKKVFTSKNSKAGSSSKKGKSILKKAKTKNTDPTPHFDPISILKNKNINSKSKLEDMILYSIVKKSANNPVGASVGVLKKYLVTMFDKKLNEKTNKQINNEIAKLVTYGKILNTSGLKGASGSFVINPDHENFDSRAIYFDKNLDTIEQFLENLISERCYDNIPFVKVKTQTELQFEKVKEQRKAKKESLYEKLRPMYELELGMFSIMFKNGTI